MGHGSNNYFAVKLKGLRGIVPSWGLDKRFPVLGQNYVARGMSSRV